MRRKSFKNHKRAGASKMVAGLLLGGIVGATVGWLTAPAPGAEMRRRLRGKGVNVRERFKTAEGNVESRARDLAEELDPDAEQLQNPSTTRRNPVASAEK